LDDAIDAKPLDDADFRDRFERQHDTYMRMRWEDMSLTVRDIHILSPLLKQCHSFSPV